MSWGFYTSDGELRTLVTGTGVGDADTLDGQDSTAFVWRDGTYAMTGQLTLVGDPVAGSDAARKTYVDTTAAAEAAAIAATLVAKSGDTMTGSLTLSGGASQVVLPNDPVVGGDAARRSWIEANFLDLSGGTMTGDLTLSSTSDLVIDDASALAWSDVTITRQGAGIIGIGASQYFRATENPSVDDDLARKGYVDAVAAGGGATQLSELSDVDASLAPVHTQLLQYDGTIDNQWEAVTPYWVDLAGDTMTGALEMPTDTITSSPVTLDSTYTNVLVDTAAPRVVNLPASPSAGLKYVIKDVGNSGAGNASVNNITIGRNGNNINGAAADLLITFDGESVTLVSDGTDWFTVSDSGVDVVSFTSVTTVATATYTADIEDEVILCDPGATGAGITIDLPATHAAGKTYTIKDQTGTATGGKPITVDANADNIDGSTTYPMSTAYEWVTIVSDGTNWNIIG